MGTVDQPMPRRITSADGDSARQAAEGELGVTIWEVDDGEDRIEGLDEFGRPDPAYAAALGMLSAPKGRRALSFAVDVAVYLVLQVPYWVFTLPLVLSYLQGRLSWYLLLNHPRFMLAVIMLGLSFLLTTAFVVTQLALHGRRGLTLGKGLTGLRGVNVKTLERPGVLRVALRSLVVWASSIVVIGPLLFLLSPLFDPDKRGRGWHDMVGRTWLIDVKKGLDPYDAKRLRVARKAVTTAPVAAPAKLPSLATPAERSDAQEYRPGARVSAGVLGVARPHGDGPRPVVGLATGALATGAGPEPVRPGQPVVGGYRRHDAEPEAAPGGAPSDPVLEDAPPAPGPTSFGPSSAPSSHGSFGPPPAATGAPLPSATPPLWSPPAEQRSVTARTERSTAPPASSDRPTPGASASFPAPPAQQAPPQEARPQQAPSQQAPSRPVPSPLPTSGATPGVAAPATTPAPPAPAAQAPAAAADPSERRPVVCRLVLDSGQQVLVDTVVVVGRNPVPPPTDPDARPHPVSDDTRSISKTHAVLRPRGDGVEVVDQGSTNGTTVVRKGREDVVEPGRSEVVHAGDMIRLGDRSARVVSAWGA